MPLALGVLSQTALAQTDVAGPAKVSPKVVLELFTSQGCSSCPPADALLQRYINRNDLIALSVPVDYWDRLGWKDTFANRAHSDRQRDYAAARGDRQVYTPQIVVSGRTHVVGSSQSEIDKAVSVATPQVAGSHIPLRLSFDGDDIIVSLGAAQTGTTEIGAQVLLALVQDSGTVAIRRGENANRSVTYYNIVRSLTPIGFWNGAATSLRLSRDKVAMPDTQSVVVLVQQGKGGPIRAAERLRIAAPD